MGRYVILGNGVAGTRAAEMLRDLDQDAEIVVVTEEVHPFYRRPLLVDYVTGRVGVSLLAGRKKDFYEAKRIELLLDRRAESVDPSAKVVTLSDGKELGYDKLLVATGRKPVGPEDTQDDRIIYMKTLADADRIRGMSGRGRSAVVHGNGMLALEMVRAFTGVGFETTYLVPSERIWPDVLDIDAADIVASRVRSAGAEIMYSAEISEVQGEGRASGVALKSGHTVTADTVGIAGEYLPSVDFLPGGKSDRDVALLHQMCDVIYAVSFKGVQCAACRHEIQLEAEAKVGDTVTCPICGAEVSLEKGSQAFRARVAR